MNKWVERTVFLNILMLFFFVIADYFSWISIYNGLQPLEVFTGSYSNLRVSVNYWVLTRYISINGIQTTPTSYESFGYISQLPNLPLLVFVITIILNMLLIIKATSETEKTTLPPLPRA